MVPVITSRVVKAADFNDPWFLRFMHGMKEPLQMHRKLWEFAVIAKVADDLLEPGAGDRCLGFGVGREPLASWFALNGASVLATDGPAQPGWADTGQHAADLEQTWRKNVLPFEDYKQLAEYRVVDMNSLPEDLTRGEFDFIWSAGTFEHLGGLEAGLQFFCKAMSCLKPDGIAVHTTEFAFEGPQIDGSNLCTYTQKNLEDLSNRLAEQGDCLFPLDLSLGEDEADRHIDEPPYGLPHLKLRICGDYLTTSVVLIAQRGGS